MSVLLVEGGLVNGEIWANLYEARNNSRFTDFSDQIALHDGSNIESISFYGRNPESAPVPDSGSTIALMGIGLLGILLFGRGWKHLKTV